MDQWIGELGPLSVEVGGGMDHWTLRTWSWLFIASTQLGYFTTAERESCQVKLTYKLIMHLYTLL